MTSSWCVSCIVRSGAAKALLRGSKALHVDLEIWNMTNGNFRRTLVAVGIATAFGVLTAPADAAPYRGTFDPADFSGEYIINVDPSCLTDGWHANAGPCAATLLSAYADVVSTSPSPTYNGRLTFAPPAISSSSQLFGLYVSGGKIDSFDTDLLPYQTAVGPTPDSWWLQFVSGHMPPPPCNYCYSEPLVGPEGVAALPKGVYLYANNLGIVGTAQYIGPAQDIGVPEPGTLTLLLGALGGGWLTRRRRKKEDLPDSS
jgi:hypothetical protein